MAKIVLIVWPILAIVLFPWFRLQIAFIWAALLPYLFLPEAVTINLPALPDLDKTSVISISLVAVVLLASRIGATPEGSEVTETADRSFQFLIWGCVVSIFFGIVLTVLTNREPLVFGPVRLPGMRIWDMISICTTLLLLLMPFFLARRLLASPEHHRTLLVAVVLSAIGYSLLVLIEIRLSPQLHKWVYGYHQHSFVQHVRGGYRPKVFLQHGLWVGFFYFSALVAAVGLWKAEGHLKWLCSVLWLSIILILSRNFGAVLIAVLCCGGLIIFNSRIQILMMTVISLSILIFPALRQANLVPIGTFLSAVESVSVDRAASLRYRLRNEDLLLERALQKPVAGWGSWNREQIYTERGRDIAVSEGRWIQTIGRRGWVGYIGFFGLLTLPIVYLRRASRRKQVPILTMALAFICLGNLIYMVPNSTLTPVGLIVFGALAGFVQYDQRKKQFPTVNAFTRFPKGATK